jgi:nucleoside-diphosphate-sugar epimerase
LDLSEPVEPEILADGEVLCHLAYSLEARNANVEHNRHLLQAVNSRPNIRRVVLLSSTSVYGVITEPVVDEETPCNPVGKYATSKLACEMLWRKGLREDCSLTVLRPSEIIGPGGKGLLPLIQDALERTLLGTIKRSVLYHRPLHYVAVRNVVSAIRFWLEHPLSTPAQREIYIVSDDHQPENRNYAAMQDAVRKLSGKPPLPGVAMPRPLLQILGRITGRPLGSTRVYSSRKIRNAGFVDAVPLIDEVRRVAQNLG